MGGKLYVDSIEEGVSRVTSHPLFNKSFSEEIYVDIIDEFTPFGNDEGWETLNQLGKWYLQDNDTNKSILSFIDDYAYKYWRWDISMFPIFEVLDMDKIKNIEERYEYVFDAFPKIIIASTFGQIKITGYLEESLKRVFESVIQQQIFLIDYRIQNDEIDLNKLIKVVDGVSTRLNEAGNMNELLGVYIDRLNKMGGDIDRFPSKNIIK